MFEPLTNNFKKQVYSLQKQCSVPIFLIGTSIDPCLRYQDGQEWQQSGPQSPRPQPLSHALSKSKNIFSFIAVPNLHCDLDLEYSKVTFSQDTPAYEHALTN